MKFNLEIVKKPSGKFYKYKCNYRENGKSKTKRVYLGKEEQAMKLLSDFTNKKPDKEKLLSYSGEIILSKISNKLKFSEIINNIIKNNAEFNVGRFIEILVIERCLNNISKWGLAHKIHKKSYFSLNSNIIKKDNFIEDNIYCYMDYTFPHIHEIQSKLVESIIQNYKISLDELILDGTSIHCYGEDEDGNLDENDEENEAELKRKHGYSRSKRPDLAQINLILGVNRHYVPLIFETFSGNTPDVTMFERVLELIKIHYQNLLESIQHRYLIFDRGNNNEDNIEEVDSICMKWNFYFIASIRSSMVKSDLISLDKEEVPRIYMQKKTKLYGKTIIKKVYGKERLILLYLNKETEKRKSKNFLKILDKIQKMVTEINQKEGTIEDKKGKINTLLRKYKLITCFELKSDHGQVICSRIESKIKERMRLFGKFALITNNFGLNASNIARIYKTNKIIEQEFHLLKALFQIEPIFHRRPKRIKTHFAIVTWGILLCALLRFYLIKKKIQFSFEKLMDIIKKGYLSIVEYIYPGYKTFIIHRTLNIDEELSDILKVLHIKYDYFDIKLGPTEKN